MHTITFLYPSRGSQLSGGLKVVCEYANRLAADGYNLNIVYAGSIFWGDKTLYYKMTGCVRYVQHLCEGYSCRRWFPLDKRVHEIFALSLNYRHVPQSDIYICTSPYTAMYLNDYPVDNKRKFYFIQDYENWGGLSDKALRTTYHFSMQKITVSKWLHTLLLEEEGVPSQLVRNGFDFETFKMIIPITAKDKFRISMLNHFQKRKGCDDGFEALRLVKKHFPQLRVSLFGTTPRPRNLPKWYDYYLSPTIDTHNTINNEAAIYLGPSIMEGWGLTVGEAMMCGQAVACTDNLGYLEMAKDGETALVSPIKDPKALADNIIRLIEDDGLRFKIAKNGHQHIQQFNWEQSYALLRETLHI